MTDFFSNAIAPALSTEEEGVFYAPAETNLQERVRRAKATFPIAAETAIEAGDKLIVLKVHSSLRVEGFFFTADGNIPATSTVKIGVQEALEGVNIGPDVLDDLFENSAALSGALARVDIFDANLLTDEDRGLPLWELVNADTPATYTEDPDEMWFIIMEFIGDPGAVLTASNLVFELFTNETN